MVTVGLLLPVLILFGIFAVDTGNWWVHKRHLQVQADAAALAAGLQVKVPCSNTPIQAEATRYSGSTYNAQLGGTPPSLVHMVLNGRNFFEQSGPNETELNSDPCNDKVVDVKMTEKNVPWFFKAAGITPYINARGRVSIQGIQGVSGLLPIGVPEPNPNRVWVQLIDEDTHLPLNTPALIAQGFTNGLIELKKSGTSGALVTWDSGFPVTGKNLDLKIDRQHIGVRTILSGSNSSNCADPLVECYDNNPSYGADEDPRNNGVMLIRGATTPASDPVAANGVPKAYSVFLTAGSCQKAYFNVNTTACSVAISAQVDFNLDVKKGDFQGQNPNAKVSVSIPGLNKGIDLTPPGGNGDVWTGSIPVDPATQGPIDISLKWVQNIKNTTINGTDCGTGSGCSGSFGVVQRTFRGTPDRSGPIQFMDVQDIVGGATNTNFTNAQRCGGTITSCTHRVTFSLSLLGTLDVAKLTDDPISLRVMGGSQTNAVDCDPVVPNLKDEIETPANSQDLKHGCRAQYTKNTGTLCPNNFNVLWNNTPQPWQCVAIANGGATSQVPRGLNQRILGDESPPPPPAGCTAPNRWPNYPPTDPRRLPVFLVPYGAFSGSGGGTVPVTGFASFYITGWSGKGGYDNPCQNLGDQFAPGTAGDEGTISGHFVIYTYGNGEAIPDGVTCNFAKVGDCVAVLTK